MFFTFIQFCRICCRFRTEVDFRTMTDTEDGTLTVRVKDQTGEETFFKVKKTTKMGKVFEAYAGRKGLQLSSLRFLLDGERIGNEESPKSVRVRRGGRAGGSRLRSVLLGNESACSLPPPPPFALGAALPRSVRSSSSRAARSLALFLSCALAALLPPTTPSGPAARAGGPRPDRLPP